MIVIEPFVWKQDYYVYHLTKKENMSSIKIEGLVPRNGERCQKVNDKNKAIYFFDRIDDLYNWIEALYPNSNSELYLLKFNLKRRHWYIADYHCSEYYLKTGVSPNNIKYLSIKDVDDYYDNIRNNKDKKLIWNPLKNYSDK